MALCKDLHKSTYYIDPELHTWMRHQAIIEGVTQNDIFNDAVRQFKERSVANYQRLAHVMATKKTTAVHPAKKRGEK